MSFSSKSWSIGLWLVFVFITPGYVAGQVSKCAAKPKEGINFETAEGRKILLEDAGQCISREKPGVPTVVLDQDKKVIESSYGTVRQFYVSKNHTSGDVADISILAWTKFRDENASAPMDGRTFVQMSMSYGQLTVDSEPPGATIFVDSKQWDDLTDSTNWTEAGERSVKLLKKGCQLTEGKITVHQAGSVTFDKKLNCVPSQ